MTENAPENVAESAAASTPEPLFSNVEVREFENEDIDAGRAIGKMLCFLFIYTVIAMSVVSLWTVSSISQ